MLSGDGSPLQVLKRSHWPGQRLSYQTRHPWGLRMPVAAGGIFEPPRMGRAVADDGRRVADPARQHDADPVGLVVRGGGGSGGGGEGEDGRCDDGQGDEGRRFTCSRNGKPLGVSG
jgi:hypothetical protein